MERDEEEKEIKGIMIGRIRCGKNSWRIMGIYRDGGDTGGFKDWMEEKGKMKTIEGGNFNARTGIEKGWFEGEECEEEKQGRNSKNKKINGEGRKLLEFISDRG